MDSKNSTDVVINGKIYTLSGYESEDYLQKVATYINVKINELMQDGNYKRLNTDMQRILLELNISDDYFKIKGQNDKNQQELSGKDQQIYDLKHEIIAAQIDTESARKDNSLLRDEINELKMQIVRLETELTEAKNKRKRTVTPSKEKDNEQ